MNVQTLSTGLRARVAALSEVEAHVALVAGTFIARILISVPVFVLIVLYLGGGGSLSPGHGRAGVGIVLTLALLLAATIASTAWTAFRDLREGRLPGQVALFLGAVLDVVWIALGIIATGSLAVPFPPLLILAIGVHGVLLTAPLMAGVTVVATLAVTTAYAFLNAIPNISPLLSTTAQTAFLAGTGLVSAIVGNRIRAAGWAVDTLSRTVDRMAASYQEAIAALPVGMVVVGGGLEVIEANPAAFFLTGVSRESERLVVLQALCEADPEIAMGIGRVLEDDGELRPIEGQCRLDTPGGGGRWLAWTVVPHTVADTSRLQVAVLTAPPLAAMSEGDGRDTPLVRVAMLVLTDVTDRLAAEAMRQRADHFAAIAELSGGLAHEVRNPIAAIQSAAEQLTVPTDLLETDRQHLLRIVGRESDRLNHLVTEFLEFARVGGGAVGPHDIGRLVAEMVSVTAQAPRAHEYGIRFDVQVPSVILVTDADLIYRVVSNLLHNALSYSPPQGVVYVTSRQDATTLSITVRDEGSGVPDELRGRIFRPFFTTRPQGSGLGLAIAARSADLLGGRLVCDPSTGHRPGASFTLTVPFQALER